MSYDYDYDHDHDYDQTRPSAPGKEWTTIRDALVRTSPRYTCVVVLGPRHIFRPAPASLRAHVVPAPGSIILITV